MKPHMRSRHMLNALKYCSVLPVIICSFAFHLLRMSHHRQLLASNGIIDDIASVKENFGFAIRLW